MKEQFTRVLVYDAKEELRLHQKFVEAVLTGSKRTTIREGVLIFPSDIVLLKLSTGARLQVRVSNVEVKLVRTLSEQDAKDDGFPSRAVLLSELRTFYPMISDDTVVSKVNFEPILSESDNKKHKRKKKS